MAGICLSCGKLHIDPPCPSCVALREDRDSWKEKYLNVAPKYQEAYQSGVVKDAELAALRKELKAVNKLWEDERSASDISDREIEHLRERNAKLENWISSAPHLYRCCIDRTKARNDVCTCGLDALRALDGKEG